MTSRQRWSAGNWRVFAVVVAIVVTVSGWLSSGTLSPYATSYDRPYIIEPCRYVANIDHHHFMAGFNMLRGQPRETWQSSFVLRRILYPLVALPVVSAFGFEWGGLILNVAVYLLAVFWFLRFLRNKSGDRRALVAGALLATYPGAAYWIGLPYSYALIVPSCLVLTIALYRLNEPTAIAGVIRWALVIGILSLGYDLLPIFLPAALFVLLRRRRYAFAVIVAVLSIVPSVLVSLILKYVAQVPLINDNTALYWTVFSSYFRPFDTSAWLALLRELPIVLVESFLAGNFFVLPMLFLLALAVDWFSTDRIRFDPVEGAILLSVVALFLFNNLAPPYPHWQMRGLWIPRIYQPAFAAYLLYISRVVDNVAGRGRTILLAGTAACVVASAAIVLSPVLAWPPGLHVYSRFYKHAPAETMEINLRAYGRRPLGFCDFPSR